MIDGGKSTIVNSFATYTSSMCFIPTVHHIAASSTILVICSTSCWFLGADNSTSTLLSCFHALMILCHIVISIHLPQPDTTTAWASSVQSLIRRLIPFNLSSIPAICPASIAFWPSGLYQPNNRPEQRSVLEVSAPRYVDSWFLLWPAMTIFCSTVLCWCVFHGRFEVASSIDGRLVKIRRNFILDLVAAAPNFMHVLAWSSTALYNLGNVCPVPKMLE